MDRLLTVADVASVLHCSPSRVDELRAAGKLRGAKPGKSWVFKPSWIDEYLEAAADRRPATPRTAARRVPDLSAYE